MSRHSERAVELHADGYNCAQAVFAAFSEKHGLDAGMAARLAAGMGSGMRVGEVCGAAAGAALVIGLRDGSPDTSDRSTAKMSEENTSRFMKAFRERQGSLRCQELLPLKPEVLAAMDPDERRRLLRRKCSGLVKNAAEILEEMGY